MLIALRQVAVGYHRRAILPPVDLEIRRGTHLGIVGPNGSGKTTLVRTLLGLLPPVSGRVEHPAGRPPRFGYVPQRAEVDRTFPVITRDMVLMGRYRKVGLLRRAGRREKEAAVECLRRVGLGDLAMAPLRTLSGGQLQRALIARALAADPEILVLDEPTNGMDLVAEQSLLDLVESFRTELNLGVVMISHQLGLVASYAREVLLLDKDRQKVEHGPVHDVVSRERLSSLYGRPVSVSEANGHRFVHVERDPS